ncbi:MAG: prepilin peptidase [Bryobacteraceae bacterium]
MIEACLALLFGLLIGSFLNVCIYRWPLDLSVVRPRSYCPACEAPIVWYDNVPLLSYAILGGRCRHCRERISLRYPLVELLTGALFFLLVHRYGPTLYACKMCLFSAMMVALLFSDLEQRILPDEFTVWGTVAGLVFAIFAPTRSSTAYFLLWIAGLEWRGWITNLSAAAVSAVLPAGVLWGVAWMYLKARKREGLGLGDIKMVALLGCYLGLEGGLFALVAGSAAGSLLGLVYIKATHKDASTYELPFGTFLSVAALFTVVFSRQLFGW